MNDHPCYKALNRRYAFGFIALALFSLFYAKPLAASGQTLASERVMVISLAQLGIANPQAEFMVQFCPHSFSCLPFATWSLPLSQTKADQLLKSQLHTILHNRYDQILFNQQDAKILTARQRLDQIPLTENLPPLTLKTGSLQAFNQQLLDYLNQQLAPQMQPLLAQAAQARYNEMNRQERDRFITDQARLRAMPADILESLLTTGYAFGFYLPEVRGLITINQIRHQTEHGRVFYLYQTTLNAPISARLMVYEFNGESFSLKHRLNTDANGVFNQLAQAFSGSASIERAFIPRAGDTQILLDQSLESGFKDALLMLSQQLSELDEFKVSAPLVSAQKTLQTNLGHQQAIGVKQPLRFERIIDGQAEQVGWGFVKRPADNCLNLAPEMRNLAELALIQGHAEDYDQAKEIAFSGVYGQLAYQTSETSVRIKDRALSVSRQQGLKLGFNASLGYLFNDTRYYDTWTNLDLVLGISADEPNQQLSHGLFAALNLGLSREMPVYQGLYASLGGDLGLDSLQLQFQNQDLSLSSLSLSPRLGVGMYFGPQHKVFLDVHYRQPLLTESKWQGGPLEVKMQGGFGFQLGMAFHLNFSGPYASLKAPAKGCYYPTHTRSLHAD